MSNQKCFGDAFFSEFINFGPGCMAAMLGSGYVLTWDSVWFGEDAKFLDSWGNLNEIKLLEDSPMYRLVEEMTVYYGERNNGEYQVSITDLGGNLDILASLRGTMNLLTDLHDYPDEVIRAAEMIDEMWTGLFARHREILKKYQHGHTTWLGPWCETSYYPLQSDFAAMISPDDFEKFVMPSLTRTTEFLDHSIFHLDGIGQIPHLDYLLSMPRLDGIQWVPGAGKAPTWDESWFSIYEKIQAAGKSIVLHDFSLAEQVVNICKRLSPKGLWLRVSLDSEEEARELLAEISGTTI